jgi:hypothetical protein
MSRQLPVKVEFCGTFLEGVVSEGTAYIAMKPIAEAMGLDWSAQLVRLKTHPVLGPTVVEIPIVAEDKRRRKMVCLPESRLQFWMALIQTGKVKSSLREKIVRFQIEAADVLHQAFTQGVAETNLRVLAIDSKRAAGKLMADVTRDALIISGKTPRPYHFSNEHRLVNWALTGTFGGLVENDLSANEIKLLAELRQRNAVLIACQMPYELRKNALEALAFEKRARVQVAA